MQEETDISINKLRFFFFSDNYALKHIGNSYYAQHYSITDSL